MYPVASSWNLNWLVEPSAEGLRFDRGWENMERIEVPIPEAWGKASMELHHLGQGMDICRGACVFAPSMTGRMLPMAVFKGTVPDPMFGVQSLRRGRMVILERRANVELLCRRETTLFQHVDSLDFESRADASEHLEITVITMGVPILEALLGEASASHLMRSLGVEAMNSAVTRVLPPAITHLLHETLPLGLSGQMRILFSQAKALEYLCALSTHFEAGKERFETSDQTKRRVEELHAELLALEGKVPMLGDLARKYGMSAKALNEAFRRGHGLSICAFVSAYRLQEAHAALEQTDIPMKALAASLGYSHVNNFISAFSKKFGYPPGQVRRARS